MKFLVTAKPKAPHTSATVHAQKTFAKTMLEEGTLDCVYALVSGGGVAIMNADSAAQAREKLAQGPTYQVTEYDVQALLNYAERFDQVAGTLEKQGL